MKLSGETTSTRITSLNSDEKKAVCRKLSYGTVLEIQQEKGDKEKERNLIFRSSGGILGIPVRRIGFALDGLISHGRIKLGRFDLGHGHINLGGVVTLCRGTCGGRDLLLLFSLINVIHLTDGD